MDFKPTFFSVSGFLVPGIVLLASLAFLGTTHYYGSADAILSAIPKLPSEGGVALLLGTAVIASLLALTFVLGTVLSETYIFIGRKLILRPFTRKGLRANVDRLFAHVTLEALIRADMDARESYVYMRTCGLDLHWYAGRIRMMGGTGMAFLIAACYSRMLCYGWLTSFGIAILGLTSIGVALYRSHKFDQYVAAASAVLARGGVPNESAKEAL